MNSSAQNPYIRHYTISEGLPSNTVYQIYQDSHKFIWFTTDAGVSRYDGTTFKNFRKKDGLSSNDIVRIKEDSYGRIWFFGYNSSVSYFYKNIIYNKTQSPFLKALEGKGFILDFFVDNKGRINFYNHQCEVFTLDNDNVIHRKKLFRRATKLPLAWNARESVRVSDVDFIEPNKLLIFTSYGIYYQFGFDSKVYSIDSISQIYTVYKINSNYCLLKTKNFGLIKLSSDFTQEHIALPFDHDRIKSIIEDTLGNMWISAFDKGVYCINNHNVIFHLDLKDALGVFEDSDHNIWISTQSDGIYEINPEVLKQKHLNTHFFGDLPIERIFPSKFKGIWCTTGFNLCYIEGGKVYSCDNFIYDKFIDFIYQIDFDKLVLIRKNSSIRLIRGLKINKFTNKVECPNIHEYPIGVKKMVFNHDSSEYLLFDQNRLLMTGPDNLFEKLKIFYVNERINNAFFDRNNKLRIIGKKIYVVNGTKVDPLDGELQALNGLSIQDYLLTKDSIEIYNIEGDSIYLYDQSKILNLSARFRPIVSSRVQKMLMFGSTLFFSTATNIYYCDISKETFLRSQVQVESISNIFSNIYDLTIRNDSLLISTKEGITFVPLNTLFAIIGNSPMPYFYNIFINNIQNEDFSKGISMYNNGTLKIVVKCIEFSNCPLIYEYCLAGKTEHWKSIFGSTFSIVYKNLPAGNYLFKLKVRRANSKWSDPIILNVTIKPMFYETPVFWYMVFVFVALVIILVIKRMRYLKMKKIEINGHLIILEQRALHSMMNPHFVFNSLSSVQNFLLKGRILPAISYLTQFARLVRQNLLAVNKTFISMDDELERLRNYLDLEKMRLEDGFIYTITTTPEFDEDVFYIPSMLIQPFVENSIWHGLSATEKGGIISISVKVLDNNILLFTIEDNGIGMNTNSNKSSKESGGHLHLGMKMTLKRLQLFNEKMNINAHLEYSEIQPNTAAPGTRVKVFLPYSLSERHTGFQSSYEVPVQEKQSNEEESETGNV